MRGVLRFSGAASSASVTAGAGAVVQLPEEEELELGLSLGAAKAAARCRILTARDFPSLAPRGSPPLSPSNSSVSSSSCAGGCCAAEEEPASRRASSQVQVVGWPPIRAFRMNSLFHHSKDTTATNSVALADSTSSDKKSGRDDGKEQPVVRKKERSLFVKVNMDGDPIGRKVDLNAHHSYRGLASALELMFHVLSMPPGASRHGVQTLKLLLDGSSEYQLTYEDKDGDWMLVGDVPWGMFLDTVKRLRIMRNSDNCGLVPRVQSSSKFGGRIGSKLS